MKTTTSPPKAVAGRMQKFLTEMLPSLRLSTRRLALIVAIIAVAMAALREIARLRLESEYRRSVALVEDGRARLAKDLATWRRTGCPRDPIVCFGGHRDPKVTPSDLERCREFLRAQERKRDELAAQLKDSFGREPLEPEKVASPTTNPEPTVPPKPDLPARVVGVAEKPAGVLLRYNPEQRQWEQLTQETTLKDQDRLLSLDPFRSALVLGGARVELVGETEVWVQGALPTQAARFNLVQGRVVLHGTVPAAPFAIQSSGQRLEVTPPANVPVGLERVARREPGAATAASPDLVVFTPKGEVTLAAGGGLLGVVGPCALTFRGGSWIDKEAKETPSWVTEPKPSALAQQIGERFASCFRPAPRFRPAPPVIATLVAAMLDDTPIHPLMMYNGFDLRLMFSEDDVSGIPTSGTNLVVVANVKGVLYFRIFDANGKVVVDTDETRLTKPARPIADLKGQLTGLRPPHVLTRYEKDWVIAEVTSIIGHTLFDDLQKYVSRLAISSLRAVGDLSMIVPILSTPKDPARRRAAIGVLRAALAQGPDPLRSLREELRNSYGPDLGATMEKLLIGYTSKEGREADTYKNLVDLLSNEDVGVRELALDNLRVLTGRDELGLGYDPDKPFLGPDLKAWKDLLRDHELRPGAAQQPEK